MKRLIIAAVALALVVGVVMGGIVGNPFVSAEPAAPNPGHSWSEVGDLPGTMWHSNNDGSGSGLNADLLDGLDSTDLLEGGSLPSGAIILWSGSSCPPDWSRFTALDGRFPRGAGSYGGTGGAQTHTHSYSGTTSQSSHKVRYELFTAHPYYYIAPPEHTHV